MIDAKEHEQLLTLQEVKYVLQIGYERILELLRNGAQNHVAARPRGYSRGGRRAARYRGHHRPPLFVVPVPRHKTPESAEIILQSHVWRRTWHFCMTNP